MAKFYTHVTCDLLQSCTFIYLALRTGCIEREVTSPHPVLVKDEFVMEIMPLLYLLGRGVIAALFRSVPHVG